MNPGTVARFLMVLFLLPAWLPQSVAAVDVQPDPLKVSYAPEKPAVGERVTLTISYSLPPGFGLPDKPILRGLEDATVIDSEFAPDSVVVHILADSLEDLEFERIGLGVTGPDDTEQWLWSGPVRIPLASNFQENQDRARLKPIKDIYSITGFWESRWIYWSAGGLAALLVLGACFWWYRRRRGERTGLRPAEPPHLTALNGLEMLGTEEWLDSASVKRFYFRFSEILRAYAGSLHSFPALESTTEEISARLGSDRDLGLLRLLRTADQVKFADFIPLSSQKQEHLDEARRYVHETMPKPEIQEAEGRKTV